MKISEKMENEKKMRKIGGKNYNVMRFLCLILQYENDKKITNINNK